MIRPWLDFLSLVGHFTILGDHVNLWGGEFRPLVCVECDVDLDEIGEDVLHAREAFGTGGLESAGSWRLGY
jgi:hypothetical protein